MNSPTVDHAIAFNDHALVEAGDRQTRVVRQDSNLVAYGTSSAQDTMLLRERHDPQSRTQHTTGVVLIDLSSSRVRRGLMRGFFRECQTTRVDHGPGAIGRCRHDTRQHRGRAVRRRARAEDDLCVVEEGVVTRSSLGDAGEIYGPSHGGCRTDGYSLDFNTLSPHSLRQVDHLSSLRLGDLLGCFIAHHSVRISRMRQQAGESNRWTVEEPAGQIEGERRSRIDASTMVATVDLDPHVHIGVALNQKIYRLPAVDNDSEAEPARQLLDLR